MLEIDIEVYKPAADVALGQARAAIASAFAPDSINIHADSASVYFNLLVPDPPSDLRGCFDAFVEVFRQMHGPTYLSMNCYADGEQTETIAYGTKQGPNHA